MGLACYRLDDMVICLGKSLRNVVPPLHGVASNPERVMDSWFGVVN